jgi:hypothetical protein
MKRNVALLFACAILLDGIDPARAQGLIEGTMGEAFGAGTELGAAAQPPATSQAIMINLQKQGYTDVGALTPTQLGGRNVLKADATAPGGIPVTLYIDPLTGKPISATPR